MQARYPINTGQNIQINDDQIGIFNCPAIGAAIPVGGTHICTASYNTTAGDASSPSVVNVATAGVGTGAQSFATRLQSNSDTVTVIREIPAITLAKSAGTPTIAAGATPTLTDAGDTIAYSYTVNNTGNVPIESVTITDPGLLLMAMRQQELYLHLLQLQQQSRSAGRKFYSHLYS